MSHIRESNLIKCAAGELPEPERAALERHLQSCADCQERLDQQLELRGVLGEWKVEAGEPDQWAAIAARLDARERVLRPVWRPLGRVGRIAAAVVLGLGVGHYAGRWLPSMGATAGQAAVVTEAEVVEAIGIHHLESPSATGLLVALADLPSEAMVPGGMP